MLETLIAGVIGVMVLITATMSILAILNSLNLQTTRIALDEESKLIADYLVTRIQSAGNEHIRPWAVVYAHDEGSSTISHQLDPGKRADALTIGSAHGQEMTVNSWSWSTGNAGVDLVVYGTNICGECPQFKQEHVIIYHANQKAYYPAYVTNQTPGVITKGECTGDPVNDQQVQVACQYDLVFSRAGAKPINSHLILGVDSPMLSMQRVTFETFYLMTRDKFKQHQLWVYQDKNNNGRPDKANNERYTIANGVHDFQVSMGYDYNPQDRRLEDFENLEDEWLFNSANDCNPDNDLITNHNNDGYIVPQGARPDQLRMVSIGITLGKRIVGIGRDKKYSFVQHFNGDCLNPYGFQLRETKSKAMLRSLNLYEP
ncbi:MAG: hypothetical protein CMH56_17400 [Myxococcales bacterium]|nr:hypothetical protein [Myxococcales bacterium]